MRKRSLRNSGQSLDLHYQKIWLSNAFFLYKPCKKKEFWRTYLEIHKQHYIRFVPSYSPTHPLSEFSCVRPSSTLHAKFPGTSTSKEGLFHGHTEAPILHLLVSPFVPLQRLGLHAQKETRFLAHLKGSKNPLNMCHETRLTAYCKKQSNDLIYACIAPNSEDGEPAYNVTKWNE